MNDAPSFPSIPMSRGMFALFVLGFAALSPTSADPTEVLKLPDLTIHGAKDLPPPEDWLYGRMDDGTEVLTNASERASKRLLRDFQLFQ